MGTPTREWPWPWEGYQVVRLTVGDEIMPMIRDQIVSHVAAAVKATQDLMALEERVRTFRNPYLPSFSFQVVAERDRPDSQPGHVDIEVHLGRR